MVLIFGILRGNPQVVCIFGVVLILDMVLTFGAGVYCTWLYLSISDKGIRQGALSLAM